MKKKITEDYFRVASKLNKFKPFSTSVESKAKAMR